MTAQTLLLKDQLDAGLFDADINTVKGLILNRCMLLEASAPVVEPQPRHGDHHRFAVNTPVKFNENTGTAYLRGATGTIVEVRRTRVIVELDVGPVGRFRTGRVVCPPSVLSRA